MDPRLARPCCALVVRGRIVPPVLVTLGEQPRLIQLWGKALQANPRDEYCVVGELVIERPIHWVATITGDLRRLRPIRA
jgi:hypothetical protein